ncbi:MAG: LON peptidase substrate-binding domain-containing protein [Vicinamibacterales bacterium]
MSDLLPLFPLPSVVLFPGVFLPLHIFEPRYREMVADALQADRLIGMVLLREGWNEEYEGRPPVYDVGCSGVITHYDRLPDGRFNIILRGLDRFRIVGEDHDRAYRRAHVQTLHDSDPTEAQRTTLRTQRDQLEALLAQFESGARVDTRTTSALNDVDLINALAQYLDLEPIEKQALLEQPAVPERATALIELLEMKLILSKGTARSSHSH